MKTRLTITRLLLFTVLIAGWARPAKAQNKTHRSCGSEIGYETIIGYGGDIRSRYEKLERFTQEYIQNLERNEKTGAGSDGERASPIIIPVVVHIVWNTAAQNIDDARVTEQIARLNLDYQQLNADAGSVPAEFAGVASNLQVRFQLAVRDPNCLPTTGITRTHTSVASFSVPNDAQGPDIAFNPVKSTAAGGVDAWPADRYLNIWVCNMGGGILGYSSFPGFPANVDGVVILYSAFGNTSGDFNMGRTATHEIGHYLNLFHTFQGGCSGNTTASCGSGGDRVCDTPPVAGPNFDCPAGTLNSCTETPTDHHDQWMNYMDYVNDACMYMFTSGQKERVDACLYGARSALLSSDALIPVASGGTADLWSQDKPDDIGAEPNTISDAMYVSEDIWVRNAAGTTLQEHQNPVSNTTNYVYVRVRNRVCGTTGSATVRLFWAKASPSLSWSSPWDGSVAGPPVMGGEIGTATVTVTGATSQIAAFTWNTPDITAYGMGADAGHFCLLARIETGPAPGYGLTSPGVTGDLWGYVKNNNNIVWKNVEVVTSAGARSAALVAGNMTKQPMDGVRFVFTALPDDHKISFTDVGKIKVNLGEQLFSLWEKGGKKGEGIKVSDEKYTIEVEKQKAYIGGFAFAPAQLLTLKLNFDFFKHVPWAVHKVFHVTVDQFAQGANGAEYQVGGQDFSIRNPKTSDDSLQGGVQPNNGHGGAMHWWWWVIICIVILLIIIWLAKRKK